MVFDKIKKHLGGNTSKSTTENPNQSQNELHDDPLYTAIKNRFDRIILINTSDIHYVKRMLGLIIKQIEKEDNARYVIKEVSVKEGDDLLKRLKPADDPKTENLNIYLLPFQYQIDGVELIKVYEQIRNPFPHPDKIILVGTQYEVTSDLKPYITVIKHYLPSKTQVGFIVDEIITSYNKIKKTRIKTPHNVGDWLVGLTTPDIGRVVLDSIKKFGMIDEKYVKSYRKILLESDGILELYQPEDVDKAIGLDGIIRMIEKCVSSKEGKGTLLLGVPGTGKSLIAKNLAQNHTVIKFNIERIFSKYVGDSERNIINALSKVEEFAKTGSVIVFIDEIEKVLNGINSAGDGGVTTRVLKVLLEWLQDRGENIYLLATANRIDEIIYTHPEYFRAERWDFIFGLGFPSRDVLVEVMGYYCNKYGIVCDEGVIEDRMTPAEIASICRISKMTGLSLVDAKKYVKLSKHMMGGELEAYLQTLKKYAVFVGEVGEIDKSVSSSQSVISKSSVKEGLLL